MKNNALLELLNKNLANIQLLYVKLHNYHWNVKGINFKSIHEMTEGYYDYFAEQYDEIAERIIQLGGKPLSTMQDYLKAAALKEENRNDFDGKTVLSSVLSDFELMNEEFKSISKLAGENNDAPTTGIADDNVAWIEKQIWMLKVSLT
ncbi:MAG TPA: DNA starvation/stationary phase protection protein [Melioribacteraceae bacterium]|nr:DNA starvation/stationary phase protection protein [Melioribacteraceae bacterium]